MTTQNTDTPKYNFSLATNKIYFLDFCAVVFCFTLVLSLTKVWTRLITEVFIDILCSNFKTNIIVLFRPLYYALSKNVSKIDQAIPYMPKSVKSFLIKQEISALFMWTSFLFYGIDYAPVLALGKNIQGTGHISSQPQHGAVGVLLDNIRTCLFLGVMFLWDFKQQMSGYTIIDVSEPGPIKYVLNTITPERALRGFLLVTVCDLFILKKMNLYTCLFMFFFFCYFSPLGHTIVLNTVKAALKNV